MTEYEKVRKAKQLLDERTGFYIHLAAFVAVNAMLIALNLRAIDQDSQEDWWAHWVLIGWGIGLAFHAFGVFGRSRGWLAHRRLRKIHQLTRQM